MNQGNMTFNMGYDFDLVTDRRGTNSLKWNVGATELPMWVADMDFTTAPAIIDAVMEKARQGVFGYEVVPNTFNQAIANWWSSRYAWTIGRDWIHFVDGIVPAISSLIRTFAAPGEGVVVQSPVYHLFYSSIAAGGRTALVNNLAYHHGRFHIDWDDLEAKLADPAAKIFLLCNPQNPTGQLWTAPDLAMMSELANHHGVLVISDDIHCDLTQPGIAYTPLGAVARPDNTITLVSPTKAFNIPGLQTAAVIVPDPDLRAQAVAGLRRDELTGANSFAVEATIAAYTRSGQWLDELRAYVWKNKQHLADVIGRSMPELAVVPSQATYLSWVDCSGLAGDSSGFAAFLREKTGLVVNPGQIYGDNTKDFIRINLACPASVVEDGLDRLAAGVRAWQEHPAPSP